MFDTAAMASGDHSQRTHLVGHVLKVDAGVHGEGLAADEADVPVPPDEAGAYAVRDIMARTLSPEERAVIVLFHLHGFRADEIAAISGRSHDAVRKQLERARTKLARAHTGPDAVGRG